MTALVAIAAALIALAAALYLAVAVRCPRLAPLPRVIARWLEELPAPRPRHTGRHAAPPLRVAAPGDAPVTDPGTWRARVTHRGDTGEMAALDYDPGQEFPMARRYARKPGYR